MGWGFRMWPLLDSCLRHGRSLRLSWEIQGRGPKIEDQQFDLPTSKPEIISLRTVFSSGHKTYEDNRVHQYNKFYRMQEYSTVTRTDKGKVTYTKSIQEISQWEVAFMSLCQWTGIAHSRLWWGTIPFSSVLNIPEPFHLPKFYNLFKWSAGCISTVTENFYKKVIQTHL
jgi:hypothetical protein